MDTKVTAPAALSKTDVNTLEALFRHPVAHDLAWRDVVSLFERQGGLERTRGGDFKLEMDGEHLRVPEPKHKELEADEVFAIRKFLTHTGWTASGPPAQGVEMGREDASFVVTVDHHEARIYVVGSGGGDPDVRTIRPHDPHHFLHHLEHRDQSRESGKRAPEDADFYERIAAALTGQGRIVLVGHGKGRSNAAHHFADALAARHPEIFNRVVGELVEDLSSVTAPQLFALAERAIG